MGIKDLWTILRPYGERKPLFQLQGKTVAIDLSCWVCEAQNIAEYTVQPRMYLRNLYFRTCFLLLLGVNPVYVLEGDAPMLKYDTIAARNALQFKGKKTKDEKTSKCKNRSRFNHTLKLCEEMLKYMGITCIKAIGEAEAMCAYLNANKFVEGCITQDSDCFAYGAKTVYRNFSISQQGLSSADGGSIDEYNIEKLQSCTGIGRFKIIALALICGSDYCNGVFGVGKDSVLKLFEGIMDDNILERLRSWRTNSDYYQDLEQQLSNQNICNTCGHIGKLKLHNRNGCRLCDTSKGCTIAPDAVKNQKIFAKNEINIRKKALELPDFPNEELISEFLNNKELIQNLNFSWKQPNTVKFIEFTKKYLQWDEIYAFEKFFPMVTRWHLVKYKLQTGIDSKSVDDVLQPSHIKKIRNPKGIPSYEILWTDITDIHKLVIPLEQHKNIAPEKLLTTIEPQQLVEEAYPQLVEKYRVSKMKPTKTTKKRTQTSVRATKKLKTKAANICNNLEELSLYTKDESDAQTRISTYFQHTKSNVAGDKSKKNLNLDLSSFGDEDDLDVSDIIENILSYDQPQYVKEHLQKISNDQSSFFMKFTDDADLFEQTFTRNDSLSSTEDSDNF